MAITQHVGPPVDGGTSPSVNSTKTTRAPRSQTWSQIPRIACSTTIGRTSGLNDRKNPEAKGLMASSPARPVPQRDTQLTGPRATVVVADEHRFFRYGVSRGLTNSGGVDGVGEAENGRDALDLIRREEPA